MSSPSVQPFVHLLCVFAMVGMVIEVVVPVLATVSILQFELNF